MSAKRPPSQEDQDDASAPTHRSQTRPKKRLRKIHPETPRPSTAVNPLKRKIRDLSRTLERSENLPADVRVEKERALVGYRQDLEKTEYEKRKQSMIKKYHMVRFFERQKATRRLKRLKTRLSKTDKEGEEYVELKRKVHEAEVDLNYTLYCPLAEKYASLYKRKDEGIDADVAISNDSLISQESEAMAPRPPIWAVVEQCMADGTLWALRDGKLSSATANGPGTKQRGISKKNASKSKKSESRKGGKNEKVDLAKVQEDRSDEGFFEE